MEFLGGGLKLIGRFLYEDLPKITATVSWKDGRRRRQQHRRRLH
jgi:hypothetical protein